MNISEEIDEIRTGLRDAEQSLRHLSLRLDRVEADYKHASARTEPAKSAAVVPPPLPQRSAPSVSAAAASAPPGIPAAGLPDGAAFAETPAAPRTVPAEEKPRAPRSAGPSPRPKAPRRFGPPEGMSWEMALGTYWLPRIGVPVIAMAVVYGFTWVSHQFQDAAWMPYARVGLGAAIASALVAIGWKLEKKYAAYGRLLMGGGLGVFYFVVFATWYIPQTRIAPSQEFTLVCLALLVAGWGAIAQWRQSVVVALFMTLLGHFTVALSTLTLESPSRAAIGGLLLLGAGSVWFLYRNGWYIVALTAMAGSYLNQFFWLAKAPAGGSVPEFTAGMLVLAAYLALFAVADRITPVRFAAGRARLRNVYCGMNTGGFVLLGIALFSGFDFARPYDYVLYFVTAGFALALGVSYTRRVDAAFASGADSPAPVEDPLSSIYFTKASALTAVGFASWMDGATVTLSLALQSLVLLLAARKSQRPVGRILALGAAALTFAHGLYTLADGGAPHFGEPGALGYGLVLFGTIAVLGVVSELYRITPWHRYFLLPYAGPVFLAQLCRDMEWWPTADEPAPRPSRMVVAHLLVLAGLALLLGNAATLFAPACTAPMFALIAALLVACGLFQQSAPLLTGAAFLAGASGLHWLDALYVSRTPMDHPLLLGGVLVLSLFVASDLVRRFVPVRMQAYARQRDIQAAWQQNAELVAGVLAALAVVLGASTVYEKASPASALGSLGLLALAATAYATATGAANFGLVAVLASLASVVSAASLDNTTGTLWPALAGILALGMAATSTESRWWGDRPGLQWQRLLPVPYLLYGAFTWVTIWAVDWQVPDRFQALAVIVFAVGLAGAMDWLHPRALSALATVLVALATAVWADGHAAPVSTTLWHITALALLLAALGGDRYFLARKPFAQPWLGRALLVCAWWASTVYYGEIAGPGWLHFGAAITALGFLGYAGLFRSATAVLLSVTTAILATIPRLLDPAAIVTLEPQAVSYGLLCSYVALILYWHCGERAAAAVLARTKFRLDEGREATLGLSLAAIPALLGILALSRIEPIHDFYLTMAWTLWALTIFAWAVVTGQRWFRYMGLATIGLALGRAFLVDVWKLEGLYRAGAMLALGAALLAVAYGYTRWRASQEPGDVTEDGGSDNAAG